MKKLLSGIILVLIILAGVTFGTKTTKSIDTAKNVLPTVVVNPHKDTGEHEEKVETVGIPSTIKIPKFNVNAPVEQVGLDGKRNMDVPKNADDAGWYKLGPRPGEKGNAVLDGHLDKVTGAPAIFWNVAKLVPGDKILITDENGKLYTFSVTSVAKYPYDNFPIQEVFGPTDKYMLNLISCNGVWNTQTHNYSHRTVVYAELEK